MKLIGCGKGHVLVTTDKAKHIITMELSPGAYNNVKDASAA